MNIIFDHISPSSSLNENFFTQNLQRKSKHNFIIKFFLFIYFFLNRASCEIMLKMTVQPDKPQVTK
jgi:hypothetical protein